LLFEQPVVVPVYFHSLFQGSAFPENAFSFHPVDGKTGKGTVRECKTKSVTCIHHRIGLKSSGKDTVDFSQVFAGGFWGVPLMDRLGKTTVFGEISGLVAVKCFLGIGSEKERTCSQ